MKQSDPSSKSSLDLPEREHPKIRYNSREFQADPQLEETERIGRVLYKSRFNFDCSDLRIFFKHRINNSRSSNDSHTGQAHLKKKSNENSSSSREGTLKRLSSKDFSNFEELCENTSIISTPLESKPHSKKVSNEIYRPGNFTEEAMSPWHDYLPKYHIYKDTTSKRVKGVSLSGAIAASKDEKQDQEIMGTISKLGLSGEGEEQKGDIAIRKNLRLSKTSFKVEVIERIKAKSLHHRHSSMVNNVGDYQNKDFDIENYVRKTHNEFKDKKAIKENKTAEKKSNLKNLEKAFDDFSENSDSSLFKPFESELSIHTSPLENPGQKKGDLDFFINERQDLMKETNQTSKKPHNLSTIATEHTIDGDNMVNFNFQNNSFLTLLSATSNSFNNSGKPDFNSPLQTDSEKITENSQPPSKSNTPSLSTEKSLPSSAQKDNSNFAGDWKSGDEAAEQSNSLAGNEDYSNANVITTPGIQKRTFSNPTSNHVTFSHTVQTTRNPNNSKQNFNQTTFHNAYNTNRLDRRTQNFPKENSSASKSNKKAQDQKDNAFFIIEPDQIEADSRTTLMVKNIPNKYDLPLLLQTIEKNHKGKYDFLYLPIDPRNKCNVGYAFINFVDPKHIRQFYNEFNGRKWEKFNSEKICEIKYARIQGRKALMHHFQYSSVMCQQDQKLKPHIPNEFESYNNKNLKDLVYKQKLESAADNL